MEIHNAIRMIRDSLAGLYAPEEIDGFINLIFDHLLEISGLKLHLHRNQQISEAKLTEIKEIAERLQNFEPIQYILGKTEFYGLTFKVNPSVLIPRPETEELVDWILKDSPFVNTAMLDIGTGSGCIPVAIAYNRPDLKIEAWDVSSEAISMARKNAELNKVNIDFSNSDILLWRQKKTGKKYNLIVSNPPYVRRSEETLMLKNVVDHEPHLALFVRDEDPLIFYKEISAFAESHLNPGGRIYFEINEKLGTEVEKLLNSHFSNVIIRKDINGKDRMARAEKGK
jgi:release factor glutamine methyltransferase